MYEELVKRLRECTSEQNEEKTLWHQAADAIEELSRFKEECDGCSDKTQSVIEKLQNMIPHWIPVTERLPDAEPGNVSEQVLVTDGKDVAIVEWFNFEECGPFWGYTGFGKEVTHWMPLPSTKGLNET